jgi:hypothetical protein
LLVTVNFQIEAATGWLASEPWFVVATVFKVRITVEEVEHVDQLFQARLYLGTAEAE